ITGRNLAHAVGYRDLPAIAEPGAWLAGARIERDDARVERSQDDAPRTGCIGPGIGRCIIADAPAGGGVGNGVSLHARIETPLLPARGGIERQDDAFGGAEIEG